MADIRPGEICRRLLVALEASEGRRRGRKRDTSPDTIGMAIKRRLLEEAARDDPEPNAFEAWLLARCVPAGESSSGSVRAMALDVLADWQLAQRSEAFRSWLEQGAPSDDGAGSRRGRN